MRNFKQVDEKHSYSLDNRQIAFLATGILSLFLLFFLLGVLYGTRMRGEEPNPGTAALAEPPGSAQPQTARAEAEPSGGEVAAQGEDEGRVREHVFQVEESDLTADEEDALRSKLMAEGNLSGTSSKPSQAQAPVAAAPVEARPKAPPPPPPASVPSRAAAPAASGGDYTIQVGSFSDRSDADRLAAQLKKKGYPAFVMAGDVRGKTYYRVRVGHFESREAAGDLVLKLQNRERLDTLVTKVE